MRSNASWFVASALASRKARLAAQIELLRLLSLVQLIYKGMFSRRTSQILRMTDDVSERARSYHQRYSTNTFRMVARATRMPAHNETRSTGSSHIIS